MTTATAEPIVIKGITLIPDAGGHSRGKKACAVEIRNVRVGHTWSDRMDGESPVIAAFLRAFWDRTSRSWPGIIERIEAGMLDEGAFVTAAANPDIERDRGYLAADWAVRRFAPRWLRRLELEDDAVALGALAPVTDEKSAIAARKAAAGIRTKVDQRYYDAMARLRKAAGAAGAAWAAEAAEAAGAAWAAEAAWAAWAAEAAEAAGAAWAAEAAEAAGAAWAAEAAEAAGVEWSKVKGKTYSEQKAYFRTLIRPRIEAALKDTIDASIADGFELLDAMLELGTVPA